MLSIVTNAIAAVVVTSRRRSWLTGLAIFAGHMVVVACLFPSLLFDGQVPYFRDLQSHYYPSFVLLARAAEQGIPWPLWNQWSNAGEPFLDPYPVNLVMVRLAGALGALRLDAPLHALIAMCGMSLLARRRGASSGAAWAAGVFYGAGGFLLSSANSLQFFHGVAWCPAVLAAVHAALEQRRRSDLAVLGLVAGIQVSTMAGDVVLETGLMAAFLLVRRPRWDDVPRLLVAGGASALLSAPALLGTRWLLEGTRRGGGFSAAEVLTYSASPMLLLESLVPRLFGDLHTFTDYGYWGQPFHASGYPYLVSLYLGPCVLLLAVLGCRGRVSEGWAARGRVSEGWAARGSGSRSLLALALFGALLTLGANGPFASLIPIVFRHFRFPIKLFLLVHLPVCLLAARGLDAAGERRLKAFPFVPAVALGIAGTCAALAPELPGQLLGDVIPALRGPRALIVVSLWWPFHFLRSAALCAALGLALGLGGSARALAAAIAAIDLVLVNTACHPATDPGFYKLRPAMQEAVAGAESHGLYRWFSFGVTNTPGITFHPAVARTNSDVWLYYVDRQSLWGAVHVIDGIEAAYQEEHSFAPAGATLGIAERQPERFRELALRLRLANVRWIASFQELPPDLTNQVRTVPFPEILQPLKVYELRDPIPRAFWVPAIPSIGAVLPATPSTSDRRPVVDVLRANLHSIVLRADTPAGFLVLVEGYNADWRAREDGAPVPLLRVNDRYMAVPTAGGRRAFDLSLEPSWLRPALAASGVGLAAVGLLLGSRVMPGARAGWRSSAPPHPRTSA